jgi:hypothetical protein
MSPEQDRRPEADDHEQRIQAMLGSVMHAISEEDYEFASDATLGQTLISPADVVEYIQKQGEEEEDPVTQRRLRDGIVSIVASLHERDQAESSDEEAEYSLGQNDLDRINKVMKGIDLQEMAENEVSAEEPDVGNSDIDQHIEPDNEWDSDVFSVDLSDYTEEEIEKAKKSIVFTTATEQARDEFQFPVPRIREARKIIEENDGKYKKLQLLMFDEIISEVAEQTAQDEFQFPVPRIREARTIIENYASSPERAQAMLDQLGL